ncbi:MAG: ABC transporter permease [Paenibacillus macerans]|uniref:ABC transporter permease n=1 Tax=Paenibacillus macerans TaxID=44252 RepID=UPI002431E3A1|nr:ABC transporter permease [Paenibacillus macerans]MBS5911146.1 ABC transporter permease [Paenibacillus macerans]
MISREYTEDTLKNILTIPLSFRELLVGKLITAGLLALVLAVVTFVLSLIIVLISGFQAGSAAVMVKSLIQMMVMKSCIYLAVLPIIVKRRANGLTRYIDLRLSD